MPCDVLLVHYLGKKWVNVKVVRNGRRQCFTWKDFGNYLKAQSLWRKTTRAAVARKQWPNTAVCIPLQTEWFLSPPARSHRPAMQGRRLAAISPTPGLASARPSIYGLTGGVGFWWGLGFFFTLVRDLRFPCRKGKAMQELKVAAITLRVQIWYNWPAKSCQLSNTLQPPNWKPWQRACGVSRN